MADLATWKKRHASANEYWKLQGLNFEGENSRLMHLQAYRGEFQNMIGFGGLDESDIVISPVTFSVTNTQISELSKRSPEPIVTQDNRDAGGARRMQLVLKWYMKEFNLKRQMDMALRDALLLPAGFVRHGFTPQIETFTIKKGDKVEEIETFGSAKGDIPWVRRIPIWDIRIDPWAENWDNNGTARWVSFRKLMTEDQISQTAGMIKPSDLQPGISQERKALFERQGVRWGHKNTGDIFSEDFVEVWSVYDKTLREWFEFSPDHSDQFLRKPAEWPLPWEGLPHEYLGFNEQADDNTPIPFPEVYRQQAVMLNKIDTMAARLIKDLKRIVLINPEALGDSDTELIEHELGLHDFARASGNLDQVMRELQIGGFPAADFISYRQTLKEEIREATGQSNLSRGQRINVETATEAQGVISGAAINGGRNQETFERFWADTLTHVGQGLQRTLPADTLVKMMSQADRAALQEDGDFVTVNQQDIQGQFKYSIRASSTLPEDHDREFAKLVQLKELTKDDNTVNVQEIDRALFEEAGFDPERFVLKPAEQQGTEEALQGQGLEGPEASSGAPDVNFLRASRPETTQ